jgi:hypothetical protein
MTFTSAALIFYGICFKKYGENLSHDGYGRSTSFHLGGVLSRSTYRKE